MAKIGKKTAKRPRADKHKGKKHNQRAIGARTLQRAPPRRPGGGQGELARGCSHFSHSRSGGRPCQPGRDPAPRRRQAEPRVAAVEAEAGRQVGCCIGCCACVCVCVCVCVCKLAHARAYACAGVRALASVSACTSPCQFGNGRETCRRAARLVAGPWYPVFRCHAHAPRAPRQRRIHAGRGAGMHAYVRAGVHAYVRAHA